ncbi:hypothetical protein RJ640_000182 [Escallonia rubra]|uniref:RNase H type-1 domain-containing protein n=1 Tax=Escallonia rubra TaxID=112253 RepID=A0AA88ULT3_9ASTE|nr:hypothetical protein RJ640_000182 [Escallonia rubra]
MIHLVRDCPFSKALWFTLNFPYDPSSFPASSFAAWWEGIRLSSSSHPNDTEITTLAMHTIWRIWKVRNERIFKGTSTSPLMARDLVLSQIRKYNLAIAPLRDKSTTIQKENSAVVWFTPPSGYIKINFDASFVDQNGSGGIGLVLRNETGLFLAARAIHLPHCLNARTAEALAMREALNLASGMHLSHIIIEGDSCGIISFVDTNKPLPLDIEVIVLDCRRLKHQFQKIYFNFSPRTSNRSAHVVASYSRSINGTTTWTSFPPSWLISSLRGDMGFC